MKHLEYTTKMSEYDTKIARLQLEIIQDKRKIATLQNEKKLLTMKYNREMK